MVDDFLEGAAPDDLRQLGATRFAPDAEEFTGALIKVRGRH